MADIDESETLESLLNKATSTLNRDTDWEYVIGFCDKVKNELEGAHTSTKLLAHKIQSPQEKEALQALTVLEACVKNCGEPFHKEIGKYRFLNEMIKIVSPKYLASKTSDKVQKRVLSMLFTWSVALTEQVKIRDAYQMLKKQGVVTEDPKYDQSLITNVPPPRDDRDTLFSDEEKRKQLDKLLKSTKPEDLQAANRLIKSVVQEEEQKMEKLRRRNTTLEETGNNVRLLNEMLTHFDSDRTSISDMQMMKELYESCQKLRPTLFRLASDTDDSEDALMEILRANDDVSRVMQSYEKIVRPRLEIAADRRADGAATSPRHEASTVVADQAAASHLHELADLDLLSLSPAAQHLPRAPAPLANGAGLPSSAAAEQDFADFMSMPTTGSQATVNGVQDDTLLLNFHSGGGGGGGGGGADSSDPFNFDALMKAEHPGSLGAGGGVIAPSPAAIPKLPSPPQPANNKRPSLSDLDQLSKGLIEEQLGRKAEGNFPAVTSKPTLNQLTGNHQQVVSGTPPQQHQFPADLTSSLLLEPVPLAAPPPPPASNHPAPETMSLDDVTVTLESIRPSTAAPVTAYDKNGIRVMVHFAKDHAAPGRADTLVSVVSIVSTRSSPVRDVLFQAAAPKVMRVKLHAPSSTQLSPFNPIIPSPPITQIMIIANPEQKEVKIRYKLDYKLDEQPTSDSGVISGFPRAQTWGSL